MYIVCTDTYTELNLISYVCVSSVHDSMAMYILSDLPTEPLVPASGGNF